MQLFSRTVTMAGPPADILDYATEIRGFLSDKLDTDVGLWGIMFGAPAGTMIFTTRVDGLAGVAAITGQLMADDEYHQILAKGREYVVGPPQDQLLQPLHGDFDGTVPPVGAVAAVTSAIAKASIVEAVRLGVELAELVESITGVPVVFGASQAGTVGEFAWLGVNADAAAADAAIEAVNSNADYIEKTSGARDLFVAGGSNRVISTRLA